MAGMIALSDRPFSMDCQEQAVNQISLEKQDDAVKRFVLSLPRDPGGSVLELNGHTVAWVFPTVPTANDKSATLLC